MGRRLSLFTAFITVLVTADVTYYLLSTRQSMLQLRFVLQVVDVFAWMLLIGYLLWARRPNEAEKKITPRRCVGIALLGFTTTLIVWLPVPALTGVPYVYPVY